MISLINIIFLEILGTFLLCNVILATNKLISLFIAILFAGAIYYLGNISGGHFNSTVTALIWFQGQINWRLIPLYLIGQLIGVIMAIIFHNYLKEKM